MSKNKTNYPRLAAFLEKYAQDHGLNKTKPAAKPKS
jgi:hypothetical protein